MNALLWRKCQSGGGEAVTRLLVGAKHAKPGGCPVPQREVSNVGTRIRQAIESEAGFTLTCHHCLSYLRALNKTNLHDAGAIAERLIAELQLPKHVRAAIGTIENQRQWLRTIVNEVLA